MSKQTIKTYPRDAHKQIDESKLIYDFFQQAHSGVGVMVDVGAHRGSTLLPFLRDGWRVIGFEPDPNNRAQLFDRVKDLPTRDNLTVDSSAVSDEPRDSMTLYTSPESTGISSLSAFSSTHQAAYDVPVTTLALAAEKYGLTQIDFLKIDTEGFDLFVLKGLAWDRMKPRVIECEFEDKKTVPLGYTMIDMADFLVAQGYTVLISEWHPIIRYGIAHDWCALMHYPTALNSPDAWGNLIAFTDPARAERFTALVAQHFDALERPKAGKTLTGRIVSLLKRTTKFYLNWTGLFALAIVVLNVLATMDTDLDGLFVLLSSGLLLFLLGHVATMRD